MLLAAGAAALAVEAAHGWRLPAWLLTGQASPGAVQPATVAEDDKHLHDPDELPRLTLSPEARDSLGLRIRRLRKSDYQRVLTIPAIIVERPGRTSRHVVAHIEGTVKAVHVGPGEFVSPGQSLFRVRLMHEELVRSQTEFLKTAGELEVVRTDLKRVAELDKRGITGRLLLERTYELQKLLAVLAAQKQSLQLHGFTRQEVDNILATRQLKAEMQIEVPDAADRADTGSRDGRAGTGLVLSVLHVEPGQHVEAGAPLATLADFSELLIEGRGFEHDADVLEAAIRNNRTVTAVKPSLEGPGESIPGLQILFIASSVDRKSRALRFYVALPNVQLARRHTDDGRQFVGWKHRPGERLNLRVPVEVWSDRFVLPVAAVAWDGINAYAFRLEGSHLEQCPVRVEYRDQLHVVIAADGTLRPGDVIALNAAHQLHLAITTAGSSVAAGHGHQH